MRKLLLLLSITMLSAASFAQSVVTFTNKTKADSNAMHISYGFKAGMSFANFSLINQYGVSSSTNSLTSFTGGALVDFEFKHFFIQPGFLYSVKGGTSGGSPGDEKTILKYVEVPVNFLYKLPSGIDWILIGTGLYYGHAISGKSTLDIPAQDDPLMPVPAVHESSVLHFGNTTADLRNPDYGFDVIACYLFKQGMTITADYELGLRNLYNSGVGAGQKLHNQVISVSLGYFFK